MIWYLNNSLLLPPGGLILIKFSTVSFGNFANKKQTDVQGAIKSDLQILKILNYMIQYKTFSINNFFPFKIGYWYIVSDTGTFWGPIGWQCST